MVELNEFRKLFLVHRVLRPDTYAVKLHSYVNKMLDLKLDTWKWKDLFNNDNNKCIIINMDKNTDISITSTINRIHQNLDLLAKKYKTSVILLNCDNLSVDDFNDEKEKIQSGLFILKNIHLASKDIFNCIKSTCDSLSGL
jgi:hypothetical protein